MKKLKKIKLSLIIFTVLLVSSSCEKDLYEDAVYKPEKSIIKYGIQENQLKSEPVFNDVKNQFTSIVNSNNSKSNNTSFFDLEQDLINRLDLEKTHLNSIGNKQVLNAPIKTFGSYKRALLALKNNQHTSAYIITYPNPENDAVFYVANLQGKLLQKVTIQPNGIGLVEYFNDSNNNTSNKESQNTTYNSGCTETVYVTCSKGIHSFDLGNAHECYYWNDLSQGTPPRMFSIACDDSGGSGGNDNYDPNDNPFDTGNGNPNDNPYDGSDNNSFGGGFSTVPSQNGSNPDGISNCITNIDCPDCNLQNDINNDCNLDANEIMFNAFYNNSLNNMQQLFLDINTPTKNNIFNYLVSQYFNQQALDFVMELIDYVNYYNITFDYELNEIIDFNNKIFYLIDKPCQNQIVKDILTVSSPLTDLINQTFNSSEKVNVKFSNGNLPDNDGDGLPDGNAYTNPFYSGNANNFSISIRFDNSFLETSTDLGIVAVTLHELIHAQLIQLYIKGELISTSTQYEDLLNAFIAFYNDPNQNTFDPLDNEIHNAMNNFIEQIGNSIYNYANSKNINVSAQYCINLAWGTMSGTELFQEVLTQTEQINNNNIFAYEQDNMAQATGTPCN